MGDLGYKRLTAVTDRKQTRHLVKWRTEVVAVADFGGPRVQRHPRANRSVFRPPFRTERALRGECGFDGAGRGGERGAEGITSSLEDVSAVSLDAFPQERIVPRERCPHRVMLGCPQPGAALDIGE